RAGFGERFLWARGQARDQLHAGELDPASRSGRALPGPLLYEGMGQLDRLQQSRGRRSPRQGAGAARQRRAQAALCQDAADRHDRAALRSTVLLRRISGAAKLGTRLRLDPGSDPALSRLVEDGGELTATTG